jgi:hypothetical protein
MTTTTFQLPVYEGRVYCGELVEGIFTDAHLIWSGPENLALPIVHMLTKELPALDFYYNTDRPMLPPY